MQTRLVAYDSLGARRGVLPNPLEISVTTGHNQLGVVNVHYDVNSPKHEYLEDQPEVALEAFKNDAWVEIRNTRAKCLTVDFDHLEEVPTRRYDFIGVGEVLTGVLVYGTYGMKLNDDGKVQFTTSNAGRIVKTVWDNSESRGWTGFDYSFTATHDSAGQPWSKTFSISYEVGANLSGILNSLVAQGTCDYEWEGRTLHLYNAESYLARDLSQGSNPIRFFGTGGSTGVDSAPEKQDMGNLATHVIVLGENGLRWEFPTGTIVPEGRREIILTYSGVDDIGTAQILAAPTILKAQNHLKNTTRQFHLTPETKHLPFLDYRPGDWAYVQRGLEHEKMRIFSINLLVNANGTQGYVTLGDKIDDLLEVMYARIQGLQGGSANESPNSPPRPPQRKPSAPYGVVLTSGAFIAATGQTQGIVGVNFSHDGKDTHGEAIDIRDYRLYYRKVGDPTWTHMLDTNVQSGSYSPLQVYDELRNRIWYEFKVHARSTEGVVSDSSEVEQIQMVDDVEAPPTPTAPQATTWLRTVTVTWDGMGLSSSNVLLDMPADYNVTYVWQAHSPDMAGATIVGTFNRETPLWQSNTMPSDVTVYYALSAVDWSGNESALSSVASVTPRANVDVSEITDVIDGAMLGTNSVTYEALFASEQMWTRVLGAHKIKAGEIDVNSLTADEAFIGSLRAGILVANSVDAVHVKADAINIKHTLTGPVYQTHAEINTGIKIDRTNGFRSYDSGGNLRIQANNDGATFTGTLKSGFGTTHASISENTGFGRPGLKLPVNNTDWWSAQIVAASSAEGWTAGTLMLTSAKTNTADWYAGLWLGKGGGWTLGDHSTGTPGTRIFAPQGTGIIRMEGGSSTAGVVQVGPVSTWIQCQGSSIAIDGDGQATISAGAGTTIYGGLQVSGSKNFVMDHPTKPGMELLHASTESPVSGVEYWDCSTLDESGSAVVHLPEYFDALTKDGSECIGVFGNGSVVSWTGIENNQFTVTGEPGTQFTWHVKAERTGGDFEVERVKVVPNLPAQETPNVPDPTVTELETS